MRKILVLILGFMFILIPAGTVFAESTTEQTPADLDEEDEVNRALEDLMPIVRVASYSIEGEIKAGEEIVLNLDITNSNRYKDAYNIIVGLNVMRDDTFYLLDGQTNQIYIEHLKGGETITRQVKMGVYENVNYPFTVISFKYFYQTSDGAVYDSTTDISPSITLAPKESGLDIEQISINDTAVLGEKTLLSIQYANAGELNISEIRLQLSGNIENSGEIKSVGKLETGEHNLIDNYIEFVKAGEQTLTVSIEYTDEDGLIYTVDSAEAHVNIVETVPSQQTTESSDNAFIGLFNTGSRSFKIFAAVFIILVIISIVLIFAMRKKQKAR